MHVGKFNIPLSIVKIKQHFIYAYNHQGVIWGNHILLVPHNPMFEKQYSFPTYFLLQHSQKIVAIRMLDDTPLEEYKHSSIYNI